MRQNFIFIWIIEAVKKPLFFFRFNFSTKNALKASFSIDFNLICFEGISSLTYNSILPPLYVVIWRRVWGPNFQIRSPSNLGSPNNLGFQGPPPLSLSVLHMIPKTVVMVRWMRDTFELINHTNKQKEKF